MLVIKCDSLMFPILLLDICDDGLCKNGGTCLHEPNEQNFTCV